MKTTSVSPLRIKTPEPKALDALCEAQHGALEEIKQIVWTPARRQLLKGRKQALISLRN